MKRAWLATVLSLVLPGPASAIRTIPSSVSGIADTLSVARGGTVNLSCSYDTTGGAAADSVKVVLGWEVIAWPIGSVGGSVSTSADERAPGVVVDTTYTETIYNGQYRFAPYATFYVDSLGGAGIGVIKLASPDTLTFNVKNLWGSRNVRYKGAFRIPRGGGPPEQTFSGSKGHMLAYCPDGEAGDADGYGGSLFLNGYQGEAEGPNIGGWLAQITIPEPVISPYKNPADLPLATFIQPFTRALYDAPSGNDYWASYPGQIPRLGDLLWIRSGGGVAFDHLLFTMRDMYNGASQDRDFIGRVRAIFSDPRPRGMWHIGVRDWGNHSNPYHYQTMADYIFYADPVWASTWTPGRTVVFGMADRENGTFGNRQGPSLTISDTNWSEDMPVGAEVGHPEVLLQYTPGDGTSECWSGLDGDPTSLSDHPIPGYSATDTWTDGAWLYHGGRSTVMMVGNKCMHPSHYGGRAAGSGEPCAGLPGGTCTENLPGWVCGEPGDASPAYRGRMLFYDPDDFAAVIQGTMESWEPVPFDSLSLDQWAFDPSDCSSGFGGGAYDDQTGRYYLLQDERDDTQHASWVIPICHVFEVGTLPSFFVDFDVESPQYVAAADSFDVVMDWGLQETDDCTPSSDSDFSALHLMINGSSVASVGSSLPPVSFRWAFPSPGVYRISGRMVRSGAAPCGGSFDSEDHGLFVP